MASVISKKWCQLGVIGEAWWRDEMTRRRSAWYRRKCPKAWLNVARRRNEMKRKKAMQPL